MDDIHFLIDKHKPMITSNINRTIINVYHIEINNFKVNYHLSRQILLIHKSIDYIRRHDLETKYLALIICDIKVSATDVGTK